MPTEKPHQRSSLLIQKEQSYEKSMQSPNNSKISDYYDSKAPFSFFGSTTPGSQRVSDPNAMEKGNQSVRMSKEFTNNTLMGQYSLRQSKNLNLKEAKEHMKYQK